MGASFKGIGPVLGLMANGDGGVFGYGGAFLDLRLGEHMVLWPSAGVGGYSQGDSVDLGGVLEFHTGVTLAYEFENDSHVGVTFTHISNAHLHDRNPGVESLMLTYALPIGRAF